MTGRRDAWYLDSYRFAQKEERQMSDSDELLSGYQDEDTHATVAGTGHWSGGDRRRTALV